MIPRCVDGMNDMDFNCPMKWNILVLLADVMFGTAMKHEVKIIIKFDDFT